MGLAGVIAALLCAAPVLAQAKTPAPDAKANDAGTDRRALSPEDQELVKELAVLERLELLKNLELFDEQSQSDAGQPAR
jgi:hypothetical protein